MFQVHQVAREDLAELKWGESQRPRLAVAELFMFSNKSELNVKKAASVLSLVLLITGLILLVRPSKEITRDRIVLEMQPVSVLPDFASNPSVRGRKLSFFDYLEDYVLVANSELQSKRESIIRILSSLSRGAEVSASDRLMLRETLDRYGVKTDDLLSQNTFDQLLLKVDQVPVSLALAQAANESAWGTSRFAVAGKNMFGQWCYREGCGMVPNEREGGAKHEVRSFNTIAESVNAYLFNLNTNSFYEDFRLARAEMRLIGRGLNSFELASHLNRYSERGDAYVDEIQTLIEQNFLTNRDHSSYEKL